MRVLFFNSHNTWVPHLETEMELMTVHHQSGDELYQVYCNASFPVCDSNLNHDLSICNSCTGRRKSAIEILNFEVKQSVVTDWLQAEDKTVLGNLPTNFESVDELQALQLEQFDLGFAVCSSVVSALRNPEPNFAQNFNLVRRYLISSAGVYLAIKRFIVHNNIDLVYVFNGRFAQLKPVLRACQSLGVSCKVHERGSSKMSYLLVDNTIPHDLKYIQNKISEAWSLAGKDKNDIAEAYFKNRAGGSEQHWVSFASQQDATLLPPGFDDTKRNIAIYTSSEDEFVSISPDFKKTIYENQTVAIKQMVEAFKNDSSFHFYVRLHPNMDDMDIAVVNRFKSLKSNNLTLIYPKSKVSSYALLQHSEKAVTFGSILGVEACYWGKPSILCGVMFYDYLDVCYLPKSHIEVVEMLNAKLEPKPKANCMPYGYYQNTYGIPYKYYEAHGLFEGLFNGNRVEAKLSTMQTIFSKFSEQRILRKLFHVVSYVYKTKALNRFLN